MTAEEIGSIGKATAGDILASRKIYLVTMVQPSPGAPDGFEQRYNDYWSAVEQQISKLETTAGTVNRIFAEGVIGRGDDAMLMVQQSNPGAHSVVRQRVSAGAVFEEFEDTDLFGQVIDWGRCLQGGLINQTVADEIQTKYTEASEKRSKHLLKQLNEGILESEAGLLLSGDPSIAIPGGVEKFLISPPELDALQRWVQQTNEAIREQMAEEQARSRSDTSTGTPSEVEKTDGDSKSELWTPG
ncbi:MAG: hypothetical protein CL727_00590 [Chloroflexi bacterium]|jgi:hypothetical protein|nr:hypothetical protein [Chloroflexota bacterium]|tara:strand:+ start:855 stop:1583 length:729 start_codon:yes stop_codon:yes gene_type:complete